MNPFAADLADGYIFKPTREGWQISKFNYEESVAMKSGLHEITMGKNTFIN